MYEVLDKGYDKIQKISPVCQWQNVVLYQMWSGRSHSSRPMQVKNRLSMAEYSCVSMMLSPFVVSCMPYNRPHWWQ